MDTNLAVCDVTYNGHNGTLPDGVEYTSSDDTLLAIAAESVRTGGIPGIPADPNADFGDFVVERFPAEGGLPNRCFVRPKATFGG